MAQRNHSGEGARTCKYSAGTLKQTPSVGYARFAR